MVSVTATIWLVDVTANKSPLQSGVGSASTVSVKLVIPIGRMRRTVIADTIGADEVFTRGTSTITTISIEMEGSVKAITIEISIWSNRIVILLACTAAK